MKPLILASGSPRRAKILRDLGVAFKIVKTEAPEVSIPHDPVRTVTENACAKLHAAVVQGRAILAADTIVWFNNRIYGKPRDLDEAKEFLRELPGQTHVVFTGVAFRAEDGAERTACMESRVTFRVLSEEMIEEYVARVHPTDRAGAYDIDEPGDLIVASVAVGANSTVTLNGDLEFSGAGDQFVVNTVAAGGKFVVTGDVVAKADFTGYIYQCINCGGGAVQARGLVNNATGNSDNWAFRLGGYTAGTAYWIIGDHGFSGSRNFWSYKVNPGTFVDIQPLDADFVIATGMSTYNATFTFNTTGADGKPHTITVGSNGHSNSTGSVNITGSGWFVVDVGHTFSGAVAVTNTVTLAVNPGKEVTTGTISVSSNATLQVAQSGTVALGGGLTLADGAILGFTFTEKTAAPVLDATGKTVTFGEQSNVVIKVTETVRPKKGTYVLTAGGQFTDANVTLAADTPEWVKSVGVNDDGNIVIDVLPRGTFIIIR